MERRLVVGCMTGTSIDGIDAALVAIEGRGLDLRAFIVRGISRPMGDLARGLRDAAEQRPLSAARFTELAQGLAAAHVRAITELLSGDKCDLIAVHGQTVYHAPPLSWQMINPSPIAHTFGVPVVFDLRAADLASGGQGAPITPLSDAILLREFPTSAAVVNLGGFCNVTTGVGEGGVQIGRIGGRDVCACNHILDAIARATMDKAYDEGGMSALSGTIDPEALDGLLAILSEQSMAGRSLGTGDEVMGWIESHRLRVRAQDMAATACAAIGRAVAESVRGAGTVLLAGGGAKNMALVRAIRLAAVPSTVRFADELGISSTYREPLAIAVLGALCQDRVPITLPQVTGCGSVPPPISGCWVLP
ncbi:MAG: anhydro-N-acetylmuramic acid kinase [Phycisphaeraceae bacterium]|nr:MAG: anhydro-N-acetylmuramic acid kinase [Phycisphaeraceae bacterium]